MSEEIKTDKKDDEEISITMIFDASRDLVWKAWTDPDLFMRWWGPASFTSPACKIDLRVGGKYLCCMRSPEGRDYWTTGIYREIAPPSLLVMTSSFADDKGNIVPSETFGLSPGIAKEMVVTVQLQEIENRKKTRLILTHSGLSKMTATERSNNRIGWSESFDKLAKALGGKELAENAPPQDKKSIEQKTVFIAEPGKQDVTIIREFDAPRELVFKAFTDPSLYVKWLGPRGYSMKLVKFEPRSGGSWRYIHKDKSGNDFGFHGVYHEVREPDLLIDTFEFEGLPETGHVSLETAKFDELPGGRTRLTIHSVFLTTSDRDGMVTNGMEGGVSDSMDRLSELLAEIKSGGRSK
jgi:uncharacterized protein YndB with AHSA1/START domain